MECVWNIIYTKKVYKDIARIKKFYKEYRYFKEISNIEKRLQILIYNPRIGKTLIFNKDINGEYRRLVIDNFIVIYKIEKNNVKILRIFNVRENYINNDMFMVKEDVSIYRCIS